MSLPRIALAATTAAVLGFGGGCADPGGFDKPGGGSGGGGSTGATDAGPADAALGPDAGALSGIFGSLCVTENVLGTQPCASFATLSDVDIVHVETGATTTATAGGAWSLPASTLAPAATLVAADGHPVFRPTMGTFALANGEAGPLELPLVTQEDWDNLRNTIGAGEAPGDAGMVLYIRENGAPSDGVAFLPLDGQVQAYYDDGADGLSWDQEDTGTDAAGTILLFQVVPTGEVYDFALSFAGETIQVQLPARADTITFATLDFTQP